MNKSKIIRYIVEEKKKAKAEVDNYSEQIRDYIERYGNDNSDYLLYRKFMGNRYTGAWSALLNLQRKIENE